MGNFPEIFPASSASAMTEKFHERFDVEVGIQEAMRRFNNRICNEILSYGAFGDPDSYKSTWNRVCKAVANRLGEKRKADNDAIYNLTNGYELNKLLQAVEAIYDDYKEELEEDDYGIYSINVDHVVRRILASSEVDLGFRWTGSHFIPAGADELDQVLVNDSLKWLREKNFETVLKPFEKALDHLLHARTKPALLSDVITDSYEAVEALAKIVTGRDQGLDGNQDLFLKKISTSKEYKEIWSEFLTKYRPFAHKFRHGAVSPDKKPQINYPEAESFVYLTGLFIRLVISAGFDSSAAS